MSLINHKKQKIIEILQGRLDTDQRTKYPNKEYTSMFKETIGSQLAQEGHMTLDELIDFVRYLRKCDAFIRLTWSKIFTYQYKGNIDLRQFKLKLMLLFYELYKESRDRQTIFTEISALINQSMIIPESFLHEHPFPISGNAMTRWFRRLHRNTKVLVDMALACTSAYSLRQRNYEWNSLEIFIDLVPVLTVIVNHHRNLSLRRILLFINASLGSRNFRQLRSVSIQDVEFSEWFLILLPLFTYIAICYSEYSRVSGSVLFMKAVFDGYMIHHGFEMTQNQQNFRGQIYNAMNADISLRMCTGASFLPELAMQILCGIPTWKQRTFTTQDVVFKFILHHTSSTHFLHRIENTAGQLLGTPNFGSPAKRFEKVKRNLIMDMDHMCRAYPQILSNSTVQSLIYDLSPSIWKLYNVQNQLDWTYLSSETRPDVVRVSKERDIMQLHELDSNLTSMRFEIRNQDPTFVNLALYMHEIPHAHWTTGHQIMGNCLHFLNILTSHPFLIDIFQASPHMMNAYLPPKNFLEYPLNETILWGESELSFMEKLELSLCTALVNPDNFSFSVIHYDIENEILRCSRNGGQPLFWNYQIFALIYLAFKNPQPLEKNFIGWLINTENTIWRELESRLNKKEKRELFTLKEHTSYEYFTTNLLKVPSWEAMIVKYFQDMMSISDDFYGAYYVKYSKRIIQQQFIFYFRQLPDILGNLLQRDWLPAEKLTVETYFEFSESVLNSNQNATIQGNTWHWLQVRNRYFAANAEWFPNTIQLLNAMATSPAQIHLILPWSQHIFESLDEDILKTLYSLNKSNFLMVLARYLVLPENDKLEEWLRFASRIGLEQRDVQVTIDFVSIFFKPFEEDPIPKDTLDILQSWQIQRPVFF